FIGRSTWYANYVPAFGAIADEETDFPAMRDWLDSPPEQVHRSDTEHLWGIQNQLNFTMEDIKKWQDNGGTLDKNYNPSSSPEPDQSSKGKGKMKAKEAKAKSHKKLNSFLNTFPFFYRSVVSLGSVGFTIICTLLSLLIGLARTVTALPSLTMLYIVLASVPLVAAAPKTQPFPNVPFKVFSTFVEETFGP
ncbi:hypothetical protein K443DRAFT_57745, partial [Laccaria amethystina LaAM-08-1]